MREALLLGWLSGGLANLIGFYWLNYTIRVFGGFPHGLSELIFFFYAVWAGLPVGIFALLVRLCGTGPLLVLPAIFWVAIEFCFPLLFPWHLANSQSEFLTLIQSADLVGVYGTSFLVMWLNAVIFEVIYSWKSWSKNLFAGAALLFAFLVATLFYGHFRLRSVTAQMNASRPISIAAVQGGIDIHAKWNQAFMESNLKSYRDLTAKSGEASLVLWPESAVEVFLPENLGKLPPEILPSLPKGSSFIFGSRSYRGNPESRDVKAFNSAFLADAEGRVTGVYHKQVLLAFGEYLPFAAVLSKLPGAPPIGEGFSRGSGPNTLDLPAGIKVAPLICYEDIMPELSRRFVSESKADLLVNLTNDAWFGNTVAPWQHARLALWRAVETRRSLVRVTNTGVTAVINPRGEIVQTLPTFSAGVLSAKVEIMQGETFYVRYGDWFAWAITGLSFFIVIWSWRKRAQ